MQKLRAGVVTRVLAVAALTGLTLLGAVTVQAQSQSQNAAQNWPSKPVMLMVGSLAGSAPEVYARTVSEPLSRILGQPVLVEVRAGANGNVAAEFVASAPADGYAIWIPAQSQIEINPSAYDQLRWKPSDFTGVIKGGEAPLVLVVHPSVPARNLADLVAWVKANPGKVSYASFSPGTTSHFAGYQLNERYNLDMTHITFKGSAPQIQNLLGGHVPLGFSQIQTGLPHIRDSKLMPIATTGATRWRQLPEVPTLVELGLKDMVTTTWFGMMVRSATPPDILAKIVSAAKRVHTDRNVKEKLEQAGFDVPATADAEFNEGIRNGLARWAKTVKATGFKAAN